MQHAPSIVLFAWVALLALGASLIVPMLVTFVGAVLLASREYLR